jgi:hypothetical protein
LKLSPDLHEFETNNNQPEEEEEQENNYDNNQSHNTDSSLSSHNSCEQVSPAAIYAKDSHSSHFQETTSSLAAAGSSNERSIDGDNNADLPADSRCSSSATSSVSSSTSLSAEDQIKPADHFTLLNSQVKQHLHAESITDFDKAEHEQDGYDPNRHVLDLANFVFSVECFFLLSVE